MEMEQVVAWLLAKIKAEIRASQAKTIANLKIIKVMRAWRRGTATCHEKMDAIDLEANPEEKRVCNSA
jgi:hypothetical protein